MMLLRLARLPSPHSQCAVLSGGPTGLPPASEPWQPLQAPLAASPWKMRLPSATCAGVAPGGVGRVGVWRPASGCTPSGGGTACDAVAVGAGVAAAGATLSAPLPL